MSLPDRIADAVTGHTRVVLVTLLLTTALVGAGAPLVDDDSSLEQFESDSPEGEALAYVDENFDAGEEDTTSVQLFVVGDDENVLTRESLVASLEFQQEIHATESIDATLVEDDPITGVENVVAMTAITNEQVAELEARGEELEARSDELDETRSALETGLDETVELQRQYEEITATYDEDDPEYEQAPDEDDFQAVVANATAGLEDEERIAEYEGYVQQLREIESRLFELEQERADPEADEEYQALLEDRENLYAAATVGLLEAEYEALEEDSERLEEDRRALEEDDERPSLDEQIEALEEFDDDEFEALIEETLSDGDGNDGMALAFMPTSYEPGSTTADARMTSVTQSMAGGGEAEMGEFDDRLVDSQLELRALATADDQEYVVFGFGIVSDEIDRSMGDSLAIVGPLALLFVVAALLIAYRDPLDIVLGVAGIFTVLVWTFGFMGWTGIAFNQMFVAIPVLLIGLSIDYAIHVFMRHREHRETPRVSDERAGSDETREHRETPRVSDERAGSDETREHRGADDADTVRGSMAVALAGVGVALVWVTATTVIGFLANLVSPIAPIREFGVVASFGILSAMIVFGGLIPAAKVELDTLLESYGFDRRRRAFGTGGGRFSDVLGVGAVAARKAPVVVLVVVVLVTAGGVYGATQVDTSFEQEDFLADDPPSWTENLPEQLRPGDYQAKADMEFVNENFQRADMQAQILVEGQVTDDETLQRVSSAQDAAAESDVAYTLPTGEADVHGPLSVMERVAAENESFNESFVAADTTGDDVPDESVAELYDELFEIDEAAASEVVHRTDDGEYEAVRLVVAIDGGASTSETTDEMREIADEIDASGTDDRWNATATGDPIVNYIVEQDLLDTVLESLLITLVVVFAFLSLAYWVTGGSATLGTVTLLPVAFVVSWILGTMYLIGMPFNVLTGMITSLTIGLGVAYSIHVSARYSLELERQGTVRDAMRTTVTGTGGALLGSAATTVGGFGTLAFAILPVLRQFGIITGLTITYAFLASVLVLPSLLAVWTRYLGPDVPFERTPSSTPTPAASDGGHDDPQSDAPGGGEP